MLLVAGALTATRVLGCGPHVPGVLFNPDAGGEDAGNASDASDASLFPDTFVAPDADADADAEADAGDASDGGGD